ncbi:MAG: hypothetical protein AAGI34_05525 [Pseudomonadota bacterium]
MFKRLIVPLMAAVLGACVMSAASAQSVAGQDKQAYAEKRAHDSNQGDPEPRIGEVVTIPASVEQANFLQEESNNQPEANQTANESAGDNEKAPEPYEDSPGIFTNIWSFIDLYIIGYWRDKPEWAQIVVSIITAGALIWNVVNGNKALKIAAEANETALRNGEKQNRPYILIESVEMEELANEGGVPLISAKGPPRNFGNSPALDLSWSAHAKICAWPKPDDPLIADAVGDPGKRVFLGPGQTLDAGEFDRFDLTEGDIEAIRRGDKAIYFYGRIDYTDVHGRLRKTLFRYCAAGWDFMSKPTRVHSEGNYAD